MRPVASTIQESGRSGRYFRTIRRSACRSAASDDVAGQPFDRPLSVARAYRRGRHGRGVAPEQTQPVRRLVALKLIKAGMDTREVVTRFRSDRQALALMDHPSIAKVFDAGSTPQGRP